MKMPLGTLVAPLLPSARFAILSLILVQASAYGQLTTIISDDFGTSGALNGTTPDVGPADWAANDLFTSNGSTLGAGTNSNARMATIDLGADYFVTNPGVYELSMTINLSTNTTATTWWAIGFSEQSVITTETTSRGFNTGLASTGGGAPWMLLRQNGEVNVYAGVGAGAGAIGSTTVTPGSGATPAIKLVLDTFVSQWTLDAYADAAPIDLNGVVAGNTYTYAVDANPIIRYTGITSNISNSSGFARADDFLLQVTAIPEPSEYALLAVGVGLFAVFSRRRYAASRVPSCLL